MRIIESNFDSLVETFAASRRFATRVGALARAGLYLTETLVEIACSDDGAALNTLLLSRPLLDAAPALDPAALAALSTDSWFAENPLAVVARDGRRVLSLAEEAEATAESAPNLMALDGHAGGAILAPEEARRLLSPEELPRLKLDLATSAEPGKRLEALRKLFLSGLPHEEKTALFLSALRDADGDVRAEAARALGASGMDSALTQNLAGASRGATAERAVAVSNLGRLIERLDDPQKQLAVGALLEFLKPSEEREIVLAVLGILASHLAAVGGAADLVPRVHAQIVSLLQVHFNRYDDAARGAFGALYAADGPATSALIARTVADVAQENLRYFLLSLILQHDLQAAASPAVVAQLIVGLCTGSELDRNYQSCAGALTRLGEVAFPGLLQRLPDEGDTGKRRIIDLLGHMLRGSEGAPKVSDAAAVRAAEAAIDQYAAANAEIRAAILESGVYHHPAVPDAMRERAARLFIDSLHEFRFERQLELVQHALARCGAVALPPLHEAMRESGHDVTRLAAARLLPRIVEESPGLTAPQLLPLAASLEAMIADEESEFPDRGPLYIALGRIAAHPGFPGARADAVATLLRDSAGRSSAVYDVLEAMGYVAAGSNLSNAERLEVGYQLLGVLKKGVPGPSARVRRNAEGEAVLHFGRETTAYTDMIPRVLEGLGRLLHAPGTPAPLFESIARDLLTLWDEITDYRRIWAPAATMTLASLLGQIALGDRRPESMVDEIAELLSRRLILLPVLQVISRIAAARPQGERMDRLASRVFAELSKRLNAEPAPEFTERRQILQTMAALVQRPKMGERDKDIDHARRVAVEALFDAMRDKIQIARGLLESIAASANVPAALRDDITRRMKPAR